MNPFVTITGPSGSGKTTVVRELQKIGWVEAVSTTTRSPRAGEEHGKAYYFVDEEEFNRQLDHDRFLEHVEFAGNQYGVTVDEISRRLEEGPCVIIVDGGGAKQIQELYKGRLFRVYLDVNRETLVERMAQRGDDAPSINARLDHDAIFDIWKGEIPWDLVVQNTDLERTVQLLRALVGS